MCVYGLACECVQDTCHLNTYALTQDIRDTQDAPPIVVFLLSLPFPHNFCKRKT